MPLTSNVPQAATDRPYSESTLRNYVRAWEEMYGALPRSRRDNSIQLVGPLLEVFDSAYESRVGRLTAIKDRIAQALLDEPAALAKVVTAYSSVLGREDLAGVEYTTSRLQAHCLAELAARVQKLTERTSFITQLDERVNEQFSYLYDNLATIFDTELEHGKEAANNLNAYLSNLEAYKKVSLELAQHYVDPSVDAPGAE